MVKYTVEEDYILLETSPAHDVKHSVKYIAWFRHRDGKQSSTPDRVSVYTYYKDDGLELNIVLTVTQLTTKITIAMKRDTDHTYTELQATHYTGTRIGPARLYSIIKQLLETKQHKEDSK